MLVGGDAVGSSFSSFPGVLRGVCAAACLRGDLVEERSPWVYVGEEGAAAVSDLKYHISVGLDGLAVVLGVVDALAHDVGFPYKVVDSLAEAERFNAGDYGYVQVGKLVTVYPLRGSEVEVGIVLAHELCAHAGVRPPSDLRVRNSSCVYGRCESSSRAPLDARGADELHRRFPGLFEDLPVDSPLPARYLPLEVLLRRGGGIRAKGVDLEASSAEGNVRLVFLKEARRHAERDMTGRDAYDRLLHEGEMRAVLALDTVDPFSDVLELDPDRLLTVRPWREGRTLRQVVTEKGKSDDAMASAIRVFSERVVRPAHDRGVCLGDLAPDNLVMDAGGTLHMIDLDDAEYLGVSTPSRAAAGFLDLEGEGASCESDWRRLVRLCVWASGREATLEAMDKAVDPSSPGLASSVLLGLARELSELGGVSFGDCFGDRWK